MASRRTTRKPVPAKRRSTPAHGLEGREAGALKKRLTRFLDAPVSPQAFRKLMPRLSAGLESPESGAAYSKLRERLLASLPTPVRSRKPKPSRR